MEALEQALERVSIACAGKGKRHGELLSEIDGVRVSIKDGTFEAVGSARSNAEGASKATVLRPEQLDVVLPVLRRATECGSASVVAAALGTVQFIVARGLIEGRAATVVDERLERLESSSDLTRTNADNTRGATSETESADTSTASPVVTLSHACQVIDIVCGAADVRDEAVELQVLKSILTAVSSKRFEVHDRALLRSVRTCYNVYLSSKSEVNQNTAKATLTQMLTTVFHRLETDDPHASAPTVVVADLLRPIGTTESAVDSVTAMSTAVQTFMNKVTSDMNSVGSFSYFADPDAVVKSEAAEHQITQSEFDNDTGPMTPNAMNRTLEALSPGADTPSKAGTSELETDAFLVFRSLCKLAKKPSTEVNATALVKSKVLSLQLLKIVIENAGDAFSSSPRFTDAVREYLFDAIVSNATPNVPEAYQLSCSIFLTLLVRYRSHLKAEIGFFFPVLLLKPLEAHEGAVLAPYNQRATLIKGFQLLCKDAQLMVDLFVNYDCDLDSQNVFEQCVTSLVRIAQGMDVTQLSGTEAAREAVLKVEALECLAAMIIALNGWVQERIESSPSTSAPNEDAEDADSYNTPLKTSTSDSNVGDSIAKLKADKQEFQEGIALFNKKAKKGLEYLQNIGRLGKTHEEIAEFLRNTPGLDKTIIGDYLGERDEPMLKVMHAYVDAMDFASLTLDDAIRKFLEGFRLPGESQKIDRLMEKFAERYHKHNPTVYKSADTAYVLAFSVIMLNTDAHNPQVKNKMTKEGFIRNNRGIDDGQDLPKETLEELYDRIVNNEIKLKETAEAALSATEKKDNKNNFSARLGMDVLFSLMSGKREEEAVHIDASELINEVRSRAAKTAGFLTYTEAGCIKPMLELIWNPILSVLSASFEESESVTVVANCMECFRRVISLSSSLSMYETRDAFLQPLTKLTYLHQPTRMRSKHVFALKTLVRVAIENGNDLGEAWTKVLACVSRYEHLYALASGFNDSSLFLEESTEQTDGAQARPRLFRRTSMSQKRETRPPLVARGDEANVDEPTSSAKPEFEDKEDLVPPDRMILEQLHPDEIAHLFHASVNLSGDAIVEFVRSLCALAEEETSAKYPRVYSLGKIVEVASFNMDRIRFIWAKVWQVLSDFFVRVGCSPNLQVSMTVVDSLRQLAMKFLSRTELANYSFQNEFLRPFVVVMRQSPAVEIRELIIRCVSQMVQARVAHIKSGWKSMFMVFTAAAADESPQVVSLAFQTIERIIREHFHYIIETDTVAFTDCVNCLVAFTNSEAGSEVCLNALAFLRFCALKLAEGALGDLEETAATEKQLADGIVDVTPSKAATTTTCFTDAEAHTYFWFPLLAGLSELTFDPRSEIRTSALEVLFDTLKFHGGSFAPGFWSRVYSRILFPIFDHVRADIAPSAIRGDGEDYEVSAADIDDWLYGACTRCLELVVDLAVQFHEAIVEADIMPSLLDLICGLSTRSHEQLAACGVVAFKRLLINGAPLMQPKEWQQCMQALRKAFSLTTPDYDLLTTSEIDESNKSTTNASLVRIKTQLLLVSAACDLFQQVIESRETSNADTIYILLDVLEEVHTKAARAGRTFRERASDLTELAREAKPLVLAVEVSASALALRTLATLQAETEERSAQLVRMVNAALENYIHTTKVVTDADIREDAQGSAQVVVDALEAARALSEASFQSNISTTYPLLVALIRRGSKQTEVTNALSDLFHERVGPLLARSIP